MPLINMPIEVFLMSELILLISYHFELAASGQ
jgi:hypothetical protein